MSAPSPRLAAGDQPAAEALMDVFKAIEPAELDKHEAVLAYWLSIRGNRELPPLRDLNPLEISDAAPNSVLLELIGGGEDAEVRHVGEKLKSGGESDRISEAKRPSVLASIARKLSIVAISRNFLAFEDEFSADGTTTRCWVTLLPLSAAGAWVDYVYAYATFETEAGEGTKKAKKNPAADEPAPEPVAELEEPAVAPEEEDVLELETAAELEEAVEEPVEAIEEPVEVAEESAEIAETPVEEQVEAIEQPIEESSEPEPAPEPKKAGGFSFDALAAAAGFYGRQAVKVEPVMPATAKAKPKAEPPREEALPPVEEEIGSVLDEAAASAAEEPPVPVEEVEAFEPAPAEELVLGPEEEIEPAAEEMPLKPSKASEGTLQSKLTEVRSKADEARMAKLRANAALYEGLSAAYDFALDAEDAPEEYLRIVEGAGLKIQLRAPMRPVVKLAFDGMCDDSMIAQLEAVLAWAIDQDLARGTLAQKIEEAGGIGPILNGLAKAA
jgi:hypothetical protein